MNDKVFVLQNWFNDVIGVFSTRKKAEYYKALAVDPESCLITEHAIDAWPKDIEGDE